MNLKMVLIFTLFVSSFSLKASENVIEGKWKIKVNGLTSWFYHVNCSEDKAYEIWTKGPLSGSIGVQSQFGILPSGEFYWAPIYFNNMSAPKYTLNLTRSHNGLYEGYATRIPSGARSGEAKAVLISEGVPEEFRGFCR